MLRKYNYRYEVQETENPYVKLIFTVGFMLSCVDKINFLKAKIQSF